MGPSSNWMKPKPLSQEDMEYEIASSQIKKPHDEFDDASKKEVLKELGLGNQYNAKRTDASSSQ
mgnify:CR=1 FL=1